MLYIMQSHDYKEIISILIVSPSPPASISKGHIKIDYLIALAILCRNVNLSITVIIKCI